MAAGARAGRSGLPSVSSAPWAASVPRSPAIGNLAARNGRVRETAVTSWSDRTATFKRSTRTARRSGLGPAAPRAAAGEPVPSHVLESWNRRLVGVPPCAANGSARSIPQPRSRSVAPERHARDRRSPATAQTLVRQRLGLAIDLQGRGRRPTHAAWSPTRIPAGAHVRSAHRGLSPDGWTERDSATSPCRSGRAFTS